MTFIQGLAFMLGGCRGAWRLGSVLVPSLALALL